jgi:hypothetical protein
MKFHTVKNEDFFQFLKSPYQEHILQQLVKIQNQSSFDGAEEPEPENIERTLSVLNLTEGIRLTEDCFRLSVETDSIEKRAAGKNYEFASFLAVRRF